MDETKWASFHAFSGHLRPETTPLATTYSPATSQNLLSPPFNKCLKVLSSTAKTNKLRRLGSAALAFTTKRLKTPSWIRPSSNRSPKTHPQSSTPLLHSWTNNMARATHGPPDTAVNSHPVTFWPKGKKPSKVGGLSSHSWIPLSDQCSIS